MNGKTSRCWSTNEKSFMTLILVSGAFFWGFILILGGESIVLLHASYIPLHSFACVFMSFREFKELEHH